MAKPQPYEDSRRLRHIVKGVQVLANESEEYRKLYVDANDRRYTLEAENLLLAKALRDLVNVLDGQTEPLHPVSWLAVFERAKRLLAN